VLNDQSLTDMETCYKAVRADILRRIPLKSERFGIEPELTTRLAQWGARIYEVPISYHGRSYAEGKNIGLRDAFEALATLVRFRFFDRRFTTHDGYYLLRSVRGARGLHRWMFDQFGRHVGDRVLEAGCGIGNVTELLLDRSRLVCVDGDDVYWEVIERRFGHLENLRCEKMDLGDPEAYAALRAESLDTILCLDALEHIEDDEAVLERFFATLEPGGKAIVLVPADPALYSACDRVLGHRRRYTSEELASKMRRAGFEVVEERPFNRLGALGWKLNKKLDRARPSPTQVALFELLLPVALLVERVGRGPGLSLIVVGRKPEGAAPGAQIEAKARVAETAEAT
jgi:SAM-dependent methyltransferase